MSFFFSFFATHRGIERFGLSMATGPSALYITTLSKRLTRDTLTIHRSDFVGNHQIHRGESS